MQLRPFTWRSQGSMPAPSRHQLRARAVSVARVQRFAAQAASRSNVPVRIVVPGLHLQFGEQLKCVGEDAALGNWYSNAAPFLSWTDGDDWIHHSHLPPGTHKFKIMIVRDGGSMYWEEGNDRSFEIPEGSQEGVLEVRCGFGDTSQTQVSVIDAAVLDERASKLEPESLRLDDGPGNTAAAASTDAQANGFSVEKALQAADTEPDAAEGGSILEDFEAGDESCKDGPAPEKSYYAEEVIAGEAPLKPPEPAPEAAAHLAASPTVAQNSSNRNGNSFTTYGSATAEVIDEDNVVVTFSGQDEEDAEALAERILSPRLRGEP